MHQRLQETLKKHIKTKELGTHFETMFGVIRFLVYVKDSASRRYPVCRSI